MQKQKPITLISVFLLVFISLPLQANKNQITTHSPEVDTSYIEGRDYIIIDSKDNANLNKNKHVVTLSSSTSTANHSATRIYDVIIGGFQLPYQASDEAQKRIDQQYRYYAKHPEYLQRVWTRAEPYIYHIKSELQKRNLPLELALLPIVESAYDPFAYSHGRASGLWQFIPGTAKLYKVKQNWWYDGRRDVLDSTQAALDYLEKLNTMFAGDWLHAIAAYNSGPGNVRKAIRRNQNTKKATDFWSLKLPKETLAYVPKLLALKRLFQERSYYYQLPAISNNPYFQVVETGGQIDLATAARLAKIEIDEIYKLNPGFNRWATAPNGPHRLLIPLEKEYVFKHELANLPTEERIQISRYKIKNGDVLGNIARKHGVTISAIKELNNLRNNNIRAGKYLLIPTASTDISQYSLSQEARINSIQNRKKSGTKIIHQVKSGDSFWSLAQTYSSSARQIAQWNGMAPKDTLRIGQKLTIWTAATSNSKSANKQTLKKIYYKVRSGDTLSEIAQKFKIRISDIRNWNQGKLSKYLKPGQTLVLHIDVLKQSES